MKKIAVFASGNGSNAQHISEHFAKSEFIRVVAIYCNNHNAYVIQRAAALKIPLVLFDREKFYAEDTILKDLINRKVDLIVLAGFLWLMPVNILKAFNRRILNIHPALLPLYGGKGMYGAKVHETVIENGDTESGITVHLVDEIYDKGEVLFQIKCAVSQNDTPETLAEKIHHLEYEHYPQVIAGYITKL